jgi:hypothetical protein
MLPQAWHSPQRPAHLALRQPHSEHSYIAPADDLAMSRTVAPGTDNAAQAQAASLVLVAGGPA